jgi:hypothetical protein
MASRSSPCLAMLRRFNYVMNKQQTMSALRFSLLHQPYFFIADIKANTISHFEVALNCALSVHRKAPFQSLLLLSDSVARKMQLTA